MTWFKVDDGLAFHAKTLVAGNAAMGVWVRAGAWASANLTDGFVPKIVALQIGKKADADRLVTAGLWTPADDGWQFWQWDQRNPSGKDVKTAREAEAQAGSRGNHLRWHAKRGITSPDCEWCSGIAS